MSDTVHSAPAVPVVTILPGVSARARAALVAGMPQSGNDRAMSDSAVTRTRPIYTVRSAVLDRPVRPPRRGGLRRPELLWAIAFVLPYVAVFLAFGAYPIAAALWMAHDPALYAELIDDPLYLPTLVNTALFVGIGVNVKMFVALLLSGFFMQRQWWVRPLLVVFVVPWFVATVQAFISFHWMLIGEYGFLDILIETVLGVPGPDWFNSRWLALACNIVAYVWKWMPFWVLIFLAGRAAIPAEIHEAADVDGATGTARFVHVTFPMLAPLYLICTLLATIWAFGDFATAYFVSDAAPTDTTHVLASLSFRYAFDDARPEIGVAAALSALPLLIPVVVFLMRRLQTREIQL
jgi:multiple sugar transport system permease protein